MTLKCRFIIFNTKFIILNAKFIIWNTVLYINQDSSIENWPAPHYLLPGASALRTFSSNARASPSEIHHFKHKTHHFEWKIHHFEYKFVYRLDVLWAQGTSNLSENHPWISKQCSFLLQFWMQTYLISITFVVKFDLQYCNFYWNGRFVSTISYWKSGHFNRNSIEIRSNVLTPAATPVRS